MTPASTKKTHRIPTEVREVVISCDEGDTTWKIQLPSLARKDDCPEDYIVFNEEYVDDPFFVSSSIVDYILSVARIAITKLEIAVLIAKINLDRISLPLPNGKAAHSDKPDFDPSVIVEDSNCLPEDMHEVELPVDEKVDNKKNVDEESEDYVEPYNYLSENDIAMGLSSLFLHSNLSFRDIYTCFSELTPQQVETILLAREPYDVLTRYW